MKNLIKAIISMALVCLLTLSVLACNKAVDKGNNPDSVEDSSANSLDNSLSASSIDNSLSTSENNSSSVAPTEKEETVEVKSAKLVNETTVEISYGKMPENFDYRTVQLTGFQNNWRTNKSTTQVLNYTHQVVSESDSGLVVRYTLNEPFDINKEVPVVTQSNRTQQQKDEIILQASNMITWQIPNNGGWYKDYNTHKNTAHVDGQPYIPSGGWKTKDGKPIGTIDNNATYSEMAVIAEAYALTGEAKFKDSFLKGIEFLKKLEGPNGGFLQCYPKRGNYSDNVTLNDDAMVNVMFVIHDMLIKQYPYNTDILSQSDLDALKGMYDKGIEFLLKSQIVLKDGTVTAWCAQHDPKTYKPVAARAYELASISGSESMGAIRLLAMENTAQTLAAAKSAMAWFDKVKLVDTEFNNKSTIQIDGKIAYFYPKKGVNTWYRFYTLEEGKGFFSDRDSGVYWDIAEISKERREGYSWAGKWPQTLLDSYNMYGLYTNGISVFSQSYSSKKAIAIIG